jgi:hypothetical protein
MRNCKKELLTALVAAIKTATSLPVWTKQSDINTKSVAAYPYIYIGDVYQTEGGVKTYYNYEIECLIHVVYLNQTSLTAMYEKQNSVLGILNKPEVFSLTNNFKIIDALLLSSNDSEFQNDTGNLNVGLIRLRFMIEDLV